MSDAYTEYEICIQPLGGKAAYFKVWFKNASEMLVHTRSWELDGVIVLSAIPLRKYS